MRFDRLTGDRLLEETDPNLAADIWEEFMRYYLAIAGEPYAACYQDQPKIVIYIRASVPELRIDGPEDHQSWSSTPWSGDGREAMTFAGDADVAAGTDTLANERKED